MKIGFNWFLAEPELASIIDNAIRTMTYPFTCIEGKFALAIFGHFMAKNVNFQGSGSVFFLACVQISILRKFSSLIPEIAKTDLAVFEKSLTAAMFFDIS